ncbi:type IV pilin-like G/H family protein [Cylindrospermum sp. FACHB-282]|uniref:type IV pilin-like G/H family protein n=1 Tax=Cylindrospermum sp. FACHB-282 TaxID=2692794 RepID=UPI001684FDC8|nr:type IV pilin-like G/H family protein [Cylindrospermum sp. FACHB-282]MBD2384165.1 type IV pilin-like G/H family protein [Cylindrospermum sp. FACHB-282]
MKTELKAKFIQHILNKKKNEEGFTLIELLVVIIIIGILSAIALPSFLNQANKARASEAKTYVGSVNRAQQAYILENPSFVTDQSNFTQLQLGIKTQTENYVYNLGAIAGNGATIKALPTTLAADPAVLKGYVGSVVVGQTVGGGTGEATTLSVLCETINAVDQGDGALLTDGVPTPAGAPTSVDCGANQKAIK